MNERLKKLIAATENTDIPPPPRPPPPVFRPPFSRDVVNNPTGASWESIVTDLNELEEVFPGQDLSQVRLVTVIERLVARNASSSFLRKYPLPVMNTRGGARVAYKDRGRFSLVEAPASSSATYVTTAAYPEWLTAPATAEKALAELWLIGHGLL